VHSTGTSVDSDRLGKNLIGISVIFVNPITPRFSWQSDRTQQNCVTYMQDHLTSLFRLSAGPYFEKRKRWFSVFSMDLGRKNYSRKDVFASQSLFLVEYCWLIPKSNKKRWRSLLIIEIIYSISFETNMNVKNMNVEHQLKYWSEICIWQCRIQEW